MVERLQLIAELETTLGLNAPPSPLPAWSKAARLRAATTPCSDCAELRSRLYMPSPGQSHKDAGSQAQTSSKAKLKEKMQGGRDSVENRESDHATSDHSSSSSPSDDGEDVEAEGNRNAARTDEKLTREGFLIVHLKKDLDNKPNRNGGSTSLREVLSSEGEVTKKASITRTTQPPSQLTTNAGSSRPSQQGTPSPPLEPPNSGRLPKSRSVTTPSQQVQSPGIDAHVVSSSSSLSPAQVQAQAQTLVQGHSSPSANAAIAIEAALGLNNLAAFSWWVSAPALAEHVKMAAEELADLAQEMGDEGVEMTKEQQTDRTLPAGKVTENELSEKLAQLGYQDADRECDEPSIREFLDDYSRRVLDALS